MKDPVGGWLQALKRRNLSKATVRRRRLTARRLEQWMEPRGVLQASTDDIETWLDTLSVTPQTRSHYRSDLVSFYGWAVRHRLLRIDPTENVEKPQRPRYLPRPIADDDLLLAMELASPKMRITLALAAFAALRAQEIASLTVDDVDLDRAVIRVRQGKGAKDRVVAISTTLLSEIRRYQPPRRGPFVPTIRGQHYRNGSLSSLVCNYFRSIGIRSSLHRSRHFAATKALQGSGNIRAVQELLGHASLNTTAVYTQVTAQETREAVESIRIGSTLVGEGNA